MGYMPSHYLDLPPLCPRLHAKSVFKSPPSALQSNGSHAKSLFKSSPSLPYKAMGYMLSHYHYYYLNLPPSALQSNDQHAK